MKSRSYRNYLQKLLYPEHLVCVLCGLLQGGEVLLEDKLPGALHARYAATPHTLHPAIPSHSPPCSPPSSDLTGQS